MIISHLLTAYAVQSSVEQIRTSLTKRFDSLPKIPCMFYDWNNGFTEQLKQALAKIPQQERVKPWFVVLYSYGESKPCKYQPRTLPNVVRYTGQTEKGYPTGSEVDCRLMTVGVVCDIVTADSNYADSLSLDRAMEQSYVSSFTYQDIFYPLWQPGTEVKSGFYYMPSVPNGAMYLCVQGGITGTIIPNWTTEIDSLVNDGTVVWKSVEPLKAQASISDYTLPTLTSSKVYDEGLLYTIRFGYNLNYVGIRDFGTELKPLEGYQTYLYSHYFARDYVDPQDIASSSIPGEEVPPVNPEEDPANKDDEQLDSAFIDLTGEFGGEVEET